MNKSSMRNIVLLYRHEPKRSATRPQQHYEVEADTEQSRGVSVVDVLQVERLTAPRTHSQPWKETKGQSDGSYSSSLSTAAETGNMQNVVH